MNVCTTEGASTKYVTLKHQLSSLERLDIHSHPTALSSLLRSVMLHNLHVIT